MYSGQGQATPEQSAQIFSQLLHRLGYVPPTPPEKPHARSRRANSSFVSDETAGLRTSGPARDSPGAEQWEWLFADMHSLERNAGPKFLMWLCDNLTTRNLLTKEQQEEFEELQRRGMDLDGEQLEEALRSSANTMKDNAYSMDQLRQQMSILSMELSHEEQRLERKKRQRDAMLHGLNEQKQNLNRLSQNARSREDITASIKRAVQLNRNSEFNSTIEKLTETAEALLKMYNGLTSASHAVDSEVPTTAEYFFAGINLQQYAEEDRRFTKQLIEFSTKQFELQKQVKLLEDEQDHDTEDLALVQGLTTAEHTHYSKELERLRIAYKHGEEQLLIAMVELAKSKAELDVATQQTDMMDEYHQMDVDTVCGKIESLSREIEQYKAFLSESMETIPHLLQELSELESTSVLEGSYDLRLARQEYHLAKQDRVLQHLLSQRSRHEFLVKCLEAEEKRVRFTHNLLEAIQVEFENTCEGLNRRLNEYTRLVDPATGINPRVGTIGGGSKGPTLIQSNDTLLRTVHDIAANAPEDLTTSASNRQHQQRENPLHTRNAEHGDLGYITLDNLHAKAENMMTEMKTVENDIKFSGQRTDSHLDETMDRYTNLENVLFGKSATFLQPWLVPGDVEATMRQVDDKSEQLEQQIKHIDDYRKQKLSNKTLDVLAYERKKFVKRIMSAPE